MDTFREGNGTPHSCIFIWKIPWMEEPGGLQSGVAKSLTRLRDFTFTFHFHALEKEMATHSSVLAWRIPGTGEPGGLLSVGSHRVRHDWSDLAAEAAAEKSISGMENSKYKGFEAERCLWKWKLLSRASWLCDPMNYTYSPWNSWGQNTGVGSCSPLQGISSAQGLNPGLPLAGGFFTSWAMREAQDYWSG